MNTILILAAVTLGQYSMDCRVNCRAIYSNPIVYSHSYYSHVPIRFDIRYTGRIYSRHYAPIRLPDGSTIQVPVINGILPCVTIFYSGGYENRICTYNTGVYYRGALMQYSDVSQKAIEPPFTPIRETRSIDINTGLPEVVLPKNSVIQHKMVLPIRDTDKSTELQFKETQLEDPVSALPTKENISKKVIPTREVFPEEEPDFTKSFPNYDKSNE